MAVVKVRGSEHSKALHLFEITEDGIVVGEVLADYDALLTGHPVAPPAGRARVPAGSTKRRKKPSSR
jgi:circadian clock protein KaiC